MHNERKSCDCVTWLYYVMWFCVCCQVVEKHPSGLWKGYVVANNNSSNSSGGQGHAGANQGQGQTKTGYFPANCVVLLETKGKGHLSCVFTPPDVFPFVLAYHPIPTITVCPCAFPLLASSTLPASSPFRRLPPSVVFHSSGALAPCFPYPTVCGRPPPPPSVSPLPQVDVVCTRLKSTALTVGTCVWQMMASLIALCNKSWWVFLSKQYAIVWCM